MSKTTDEILYELMEELDSRPDSDVPTTKGLLVLSTPRSGSSMYCDVLSQLGSVGECKEWFNLRYLGAYAKYKGLKDVDFPAYLDFITRKTTSNTGVLAVNMHIEQHLALLKHKLNVFNLNFGSVVYLERKNKLAQAVSLTKANLTDAWSAESKVKSELPSNIGNGIITKSLVQLAESQDYYENNLAKSVHHHFYYEDFKTLEDLSCFQLPLAKLSIEISDDLKLASNLKVQRDAKSDFLIEQYERFLFGK